MDSFDDALASLPQEEADKILEELNALDLTNEEDLVKFAEDRMQEIIAKKRKVNRKPQPESDDPYYQMMKDELSEMTPIIEDN